MNLQQTFSSPQHFTVLMAEAVAGLKLKENGTYIDGTFGRGGHSRYILSQLNSQGRLIAMDRDPQAVQAGLEIKDPRFEIYHQPFSALASRCESLDLIGKVDGVLLDLGISSPQIDTPERGFSFMHDGVLDMRMDTSSGISAREWLQKVSVDDLTWVIKNYGEERFAKQIARAIVNFNQQAITQGTSPLETTAQLANLIVQAVPFKDKFKHPATRTFQAIRIFINGELDELEAVLNQALEVLSPAGRLAVISFHSLEDRMVKNFLRQEARGIEIPKGLPIKDNEFNRQQRVKLIGKVIKPSEEEVAINPRSRSAVLRVGEKI